MVNCPKCKSEVRYIEKNQRYFCDACKEWQAVSGAQPSKNYRLVGTVTPALEYKVGPGKVLFGQPGLMVTREPTVTMQGKTKGGLDRKSTRLNSSHTDISRMPSSA